ncbi:MAG: YlbF family regulator [Bacillota bacterium]
MSRTSIMDKARELGQELAASPEYIEMRQAEANIIRDPQASSVVQNFQELKKAWEKAQIQGIHLPQAHLQKLQEAEERMLLNPVVRNFTEAHQRFLEVLQEVNHTIWEGIRGCSCDEGECGSG